MWKTPNQYFGTLHIISIVVMLCCAACGIYLGIKYRDAKYDKKKDKAMSILGFVFVALEAFKIIFRVAADAGADERLISFQICSIPLWLLPWIAYMKEGKLKKSFIGFVSFQSFTAAFFFFVKPAAIVMSESNFNYIVLSMHSLLWHCLMVASGLFAMVAYRLLTKEGFKTLVYSYILWVICAVVAMILNIIIGGKIDLFSIAPNTDFSYPLLGVFFKSPKPYPLFFISFLIYYGLGGLIIYGLGFGITKLATKKK